MRRSLFGRIALVVLLVWIGASAVIAIASVPLRRVPRLNPGPRLAQRAVHYFTQLIGVPPDYETAARIADELGLQIQIDGPDGSWVWPQQLQLRQTPFDHHGPNPRRGGPRIGHNRGPHQTISVMRAGYRFTYRLRAPAPRTAVPLGYGLALGLALLALLLTIRRTLAPLQHLEHAAARIRDGDLGHRVAPAGPREIERLGQSFNQMATRVQQMVADREQLLADVSHELRSPIGRMRLGVEMLPAGSRREQLERELLEMQELVTTLLDLSRLSSEAPQQTSDRTALDLSALVQAEVGRNAAVRYRPASDSSAPVKVVGDATQLTVALRNLIDNALRYNPSDVAPVRVELRRGTERVEIAVIDHGPGVSPQLRERIFEPFVRGDYARARHDGGYGLGLALARRVARTHGGDVFLTADTPGSTFVLWLPLAVE